MFPEIGFKSGPSINNTSQGLEGVPWFAQQIFDKRYDCLGIGDRNQRVDNFHFSLGTEFGKREIR